MLAVAALLIELTDLVRAMRTDTCMSDEGYGVLHKHCALTVLLSGGDMHVQALLTY